MFGELGHAARPPSRHRGKRLKRLRTMLARVERLIEDKAAKPDTDVVALQLLRAEREALVFALAELDPL